ncbi:hypothetical protein [Gordonia sp. (in: high G+C Gram-positive bacteria)]|uniref:hypothetical protein n=1 Tax=Gordonia sp. (in: high G+C Gram-positive bacteria) TaxID=84139 RepID=UPI003F99A890
MKKQFAALVAASAIVVLAGCGSDDGSATKASSVAETTPTTTDEITSWKTFGQVGVHLYSECGDGEWGCLSDQIAALRDAAQTLPADAEHDPGSLTLFLDTYNKWETDRCWINTADRMCVVYDMQLNTHSEGILRGMQRFADEP